MELLFNKLIEKKLTISFAESMTGGYLSSSLTKYPNASKVFKGAIIAYDNNVKNSLLNVDLKLISQYSVVSKEVSYSMVNGLSKAISSDIHVSITGNAGPTNQVGTYENECFFSVKFKNEINTFHLKFVSDNRIENIKRASTEIEKSVLNLIK